MPPSTCRTSWIARARAFPLALLFAVGAANAKQYEIEVIVFDRPDAVADARAARDESHWADSPLEHAPQRSESDISEQWDFSAPRIAAHLQRMATLAEQSSERATFNQLGRLEVARLRLIKSGYRILNTTRWQQPTSTYRYAPLIALVRADDDAPIDSLIDSPTEAQANAPATPLAAGFVRVYTTSLIYADIDLQLSPLPPDALAALDETSAPESLADDASADDVSVDATSVDVVSADVASMDDASADDASADDEPPAHYFITEKRRLKFGQIHYFDHPLFGALLGVWLIED